MKRSKLVKTERTTVNVLREALRDAERGEMKEVIVLMKRQSGNWSRDHAGVEISNDERWIRQFLDIHPHAS